VDPVVRWRCLAKGRVQGVGYRARVAAAAARLGVGGTVRNLADGTVSIDAQARASVLESFLSEIRGPHGSSDAETVERVETMPVAVDRSEFEIAP
jgi:acylphosphatase